MLSEDAKRVVREQRLAYVATVAPDGSPRVSPKGTTAVWDNEHLVFADIRSPGPIANLQKNPAIEINVVDPLVRKGFRFRGVGTVLMKGDLFDEIVASYRRRGVLNPIRAVVLVNVVTELPLTSPVYDLGVTESAVRKRWEGYWAEIARGNSGAETGE